MENNFAARLKLAMERKGLKQVDVLRAAEEKGLKLGKSHVSQYVAGKSVPRDNILNFLAELLSVSPQWLKNGEEEKTENNEIELPGAVNMTFKKSSKLLRNIGTSSLY